MGFLILKKRQTCGNGGIRWKAELVKCGSLHFHRFFFFFLRIKKPIILDNYVYFLFHNFKPSKMYYINECWIVYLISCHNYFFCWKWKNKTETETETGTWIRRHASAFRKSETSSISNWFYYTLLSLMLNLPSHRGSLVQESITRWDFFQSKNRCDQPSHIQWRQSCFCTKIEK